MKNNYKITIGCEIHCQLISKQKMFSNTKIEKTKNFNTNISSIDLGHPGALPQINFDNIKKAILLSDFLNAKINKKIFFERKNYFYPDLPKGFQITQKNRPIGKNGFLNIFRENNKKFKVFIEQIQIEEDTAQQFKHKNYSTYDFNRSGIGLIEIITTPCFSNYDEIIVFLKTLTSILRIYNISKAKLEDGSIRVDVNISISKSLKLGTRVEIKNLNSFKNIRNAIKYEFLFQKKTLEEDNKILFETKGYDEKAQKTFVLRKKTNDYDYFFLPEINLPIFNFENYKPNVNHKDFFNILNNNLYNYDELNIFLNNTKFLQYFILLYKKNKPKDVIFLIVNICNIFKTYFWNLSDEKAIKIILELIKIKGENNLTINELKLICNNFFKKKINFKITLKTLKNKINVNENILDETIDKIIKDNDKIIKRVKSDKKRLNGFMIGQIMKKIEIKGNLSLVIEKIKKRFEN